MGKLLDHVITARLNEELGVRVESPPKQYGLDPVEALWTQLKRCATSLQKRNEKLKTRGICTLVTVDVNR